MARALKSEKFMLLNFQKVSIMCPRWLSLSGEDALMAVTSKTEAWQKHYLRLSLFLSKAALRRQNKSSTAKSNCETYSRVDIDGIFPPSSAF